MQGRFASEHRMSSSTELRVRPIFAALRLWLLAGRRRGRLRNVGWRVYDVEKGRCVRLFFFLSLSKKNG